MARMVEQGSGNSGRAQSNQRPASGHSVSSSSANERRQRIVLTCASCGGRNYRKTKARREGTAPIQLSKFCNICNAHTLHREAV